MIDLKAYRAQYPEYDKIPDDKLRRAIEKKQAAESGMIADEDLERKMVNGIQSMLMSPDMNSAMAGREGLLSGLKDLWRGYSQAARTTGEFLGITPKGNADEYTQEVDALRKSEAQNASERFPNDALAYGAGKFGGEALPFMAIPGAQGGIAAKIIQGALSGGGIGASQYVPEGESRLQNTLFGGLLGGGAPATGAALTSAPAKAIVGGAKNLFDKGAKHLLPNTKYSEKLIAKDLTNGIDIEKALKVKKEANELGLQLTPGQASGSESVMAAERALGRSKEGQAKLEEFARLQKEQGKNVTRETLKKISPEEVNASATIREKSREKLTDQEKLRKDISEPFYKMSENKIIPGKDIDKLYQEYPAIADAYKKVLSDKDYASELKEFSNDSIKVADLVKRELGDRIESLKGDKKKNKARLVDNARKALINVADNASEDYKIARELFSEGSKGLDKLNQSTIKIIADLPDAELKKVSQTIFDNTETNKKSFDEMRDTFVKKDPKAWMNIIRNEMERRLSHTKDSESLPNFFKTILEKDADFNQFISATKGMPELQKRLTYMRSAAKNFYKIARNKAIDAAEKASIGITKEANKEVSKSFFSGYDKKAIDIMTSPDWDKYLVDIAKTSDKMEKAKKFLNLLKTPAQRATVVAATSPKEAKK